MCADNIKKPDNSHEAFDDEFRMLYESALLDEIFQQDRLDDIQKLPLEKQQFLNENEQAFQQQKKVPDDLIQKILVNLPHCDSAPEAPAVSITAKKPKAGFLKRLFSWRSDSFSFLSPGIAVPASLAFGILAGVIFAPLLDPSSTYQDDQFRGVPGNTIQNEYADEPLKWLEHIAGLLRDGKIRQAELQLQQFRKRYPDYGTDD